MIARKARLGAAPPPPPLQIYRYFMRGMEQQMWFFGQDVRHGGNLLARFGFEGFRSGKQGSSRYRLRWAGSVIEMHSFCAGLYRVDAPGFLYIRGKYNAYRYDGAEPPDPERFCHAPIAIPEHTRADDPFFAALALFLRWLEEYETWLENLVGPKYRAGLFPHCPMPWLPPLEARQWLNAFGKNPLTTRVPKRGARAAAQREPDWLARHRRKAPRLFHN